MPDAMLPDARDAPRRRMCPMETSVRVPSAPASNEMLYVSTRGGSEPVSFADAVVDTFASDGGLFMPQSIPKVSSEELDRWSTLNYADLTTAVLSLFVTGEGGMSDEELATVVKETFRAFESPETVPTPAVGDNMHVVELFHGPTLSFKDLGQGFLCRALHVFLQRRGVRTSVLVATSGDTGPAAMHAAKGLSSIDLWVLYPKGMVSDAQEDQMRAFEASNVHVVAISGACSDSIDEVMKRVMSDASFTATTPITSVNSFNIARVLINVVHYVWAYLRLAPKDSATGRRGKLRFAVPIGACGNVIGGTMARGLGLDLELIFASNANDTVYRTFDTGTYKPNPTIATVSNAMDICVPYNFERFLFLQACAGDSCAVARHMKDADTTGQFTLTPEELERARQGNQWSTVNDDETKAVIGDVWEKHKYLLCPHTGVGVVAGQQKAPADGGKVAVISTAHPAKFMDTLKAALKGTVPAQASHQGLAALAGKPSTCFNVGSEQECEALLRKEMPVSFAKLGRTS